MGFVCRAEGALVRAGEDLDGNFDVDDDEEDEDGLLGEPSVPEDRRDKGQSPVTSCIPLRVQADVTTRCYDLI